jgi:hypothetical protein
VGSQRLIRRPGARISSGGACAGRNPPPSPVPTVMVALFTDPAVAAAAVPSWMNSMVARVPLAASMRLRSHAVRPARLP